jgi:hypothetical protein
MASGTVETNTTVMIRSDMPFHFFQHPADAKRLKLFIPKIAVPIMVGHESKVRRKTYFKEESV